MDRGLDLELHHHDELGIEGDERFYHWHAENRDLSTGWFLPKPWTIYFLWLGGEGQRSNRNRLLSGPGRSGLPFHIGFSDHWYLSWRDWNGWFLGIGDIHRGAVDTPLYADAADALGEALRTYDCDALEGGCDACEDRWCDAEERR
jgi:hypothetical protein